MISAEICNCKELNEPKDTGPVCVHVEQQQENDSLLIKPINMGPQDGSAGKGTCHQA